jgi:release factor glutamine methyltransferase
MEIGSVSVKSIIDLFREELKNDYDEREINQFVLILFNECMGWSRLQMQLNYEEFLSEKEVAEFHNALVKLKNHVPVQYITGKTHFYDLQLTVNPDVFIPRPETEEMMDIIIKENSHSKNEPVSILDIGTGSGCIAVCLKRNFPLASVCAIEKSENAIKVAKENAKRNDCPVDFRHFDIFYKKGWIDFPSFDVIVSNPPYVMESEKKDMRINVLDHEPWDALFVSDHDPLKFYSVIAEFGLTHLNRPGLVYLETNEKLGIEVKTLFLKNGFDKAEIMRDINGKDRFLRAELNTFVNPELSLH